MIRSNPSKSRFSSAVTDRDKGRTRMKDSIKKATIYTVIIIAAFLGGVFIFNSFVIPGLVGRGDVVLVPDLRGLWLDPARSKCEEAGYRLGIARRENSNSIPEGHIISQVPQPGEGLKERRTIRVVVSAGKKMAHIPELKGLSLRQAWITLEDAGLRRGGVSRIFSNLSGENAVRASFPGSGTEIPAGSRVDLLFVIYDHPRMFIMPNLVGMDLPFVQDRLEKLGFRIGRLVNRESERDFPNTILAQKPAAGSSIKEGGTVELTVSTLE